MTDHPSGETTPHSAPRHTPVIVLLGGPGSGKGTHGKALAEALGYVHFSSGEHLRDHIRRQTPLGLVAKPLIDVGQFIPDHLADQLVEELFTGQSCASGFVLDGYPRSLVQAEALDRIAPAHACIVTQALYLAVSDDEIIRRLSGRLTCRACGRTTHEAALAKTQPAKCPECGGGLYRRPDDELATIRQRIVLFHQMITPILDHYRKTARLCEVPAEGEIPEVSARVITSANQSAVGTA